MTKKVAYLTQEMIQTMYLMYGTLDSVHETLSSWDLEGRIVYCDSDHSVNTYPTYVGWVCRYCDEVDRTRYYKIKDIDLFFDSTGKIGLDVILDRKRSKWMPLSQVKVKVVSENRNE